MLSREIISVCQLCVKTMVVQVSTLSPRAAVLKWSVVFLHEASKCSTEA